MNKRQPRLILLALFFLTSLSFFACHNTKVLIYNNSDSIEVIVLGIAQDAGYPQIQCKKSCCTTAWINQSERKMVASIGVRNTSTKEAWLFDATPDIKDQLNILLNGEYTLKGIFLTHAHMGHYTGLMELGREALGADAINVYAMPRMRTYLQSNGPWSQLVDLGNINIVSIKHEEKISIDQNLTITPFLVPHRDEFSETVGFKINGPSKSAIFIPDIDKWHKWETDIKSEVEHSDYAFLDGTFFRNGEIWGRDMSEIPHPFIEESFVTFKDLSTDEKSKIYFIHLNHTNPLYNQNSKEYKTLINFGYRLAAEKMKIVL